MNRRDAISSALAGSCASLLLGKPAPQDAPAPAGAESPPLIPQGTTVAEVPAEVAEGGKLVKRTVLVFSTRHHVSASALARVELAVMEWKVANGVVSPTLVLSDAALTLQSIEVEGAAGFDPVAALEADRLRVEMARKEEQQQNLADELMRMAR